MKFLFVFDTLIDHLLGKSCSLCLRYVPFVPVPDRKVIAMSHVHVSAAYRSRIYDNFDTPRSEMHFARATHVPRTCDVLATFQWHIRDESVFVWNFTFVCTAYRMEFHFLMYGVSRRMCYVRVTHCMTYKAASQRVDCSPLGNFADKPYFKEQFKLSRISVGALSCNSLLHTLP